MDALLAHLQENAVLYGVGVALALPLIYVTRKYSVPTILYLTEFVIYACVMHVVVWLLVAVTRWFKESSSMKALNEAGKPIDAPEWGTPLIDFWETDLYDPNWVWKVEAVCIVLIMIGIWRYRPMKIQRRAQRKTQDYKGAARPKAGSYKAGAGGRGGRTRGTRGR